MNITASLASAPRVAPPVRAISSGKSATVPVVVVIAVAGSTAAAVMVGGLIQIIRYRDWSPSIVLNNPPGSVAVTVTV